MGGEKLSDHRNRITSLHFLSFSFSQFSVSGVLPHRGTIIIL